MHLSRLQATCTAVQFYGFNLHRNICWHLSSHPRLWPLISKNEAQRPPWLLRLLGTYRRLSRARASGADTGEEVAGGSWGHPLGVRVRAGTLALEEKGSPVLKQFFLKKFQRFYFIPF